jgi:hypothetical protein
MTKDELAAVNVLVFQRFPKIPTERKCKTEFNMRQAAREAYRQRLINDITAKKIILETVAPTAEEARG